MKTVPQKVLDVERPANTEVVRIKQGFAVFEKIDPTVEGSKKNHRRKVGYIIDLQFVPISGEQQKPDETRPYKVSFGAAALILMVSLPFLTTLVGVFPLHIALEIYIIACLKVMYPGITSQYMARSYYNSYLSVCFPGVGISRDTISKLLHDLGLSNKSREEYNKRRLESISLENFVIYIDGTLKAFTSNNNSLSKTPYKKKYNGYDVINIITAFVDKSCDILCASVYPGSFSDTSVYRKFLIENSITRGILFGDSAFVPSIVKRLKEQFTDLTHLHFIGKLKENDKRIKQFLLTNFINCFVSSRGLVYFTSFYCEKSKTWFYGFKNVSSCYKQQKAFGKKFIKSNDQSNFASEYEKRKDLFGTIFIETDLEFDPKELYKIILDRWNIEILFHKEKSDLELNCTRVHDEFSVIGQEFVNTLATNIYIKVCKYIDKCQVKGTWSYKEFIKRLTGIWRLVDDKERENCSIEPSYIFNEGKPTSNDLSWDNTTQNDFEILEKLNLSKHNPNINTASQNNNNYGSNRKQDKNSSDKTINNQIEEINKLQNDLKKQYPSLLEDENKEDNDELNAEEKNEEINDKFNAEENNEYSQKKVGRPKGKLNKSTIERNECVKQLYDALERIKQELIEAKKKAIKLNALSKKQQATSNENGEGQPKIRKVRSDKGLKRGPYKKRSQVMSEHTEDVAQPTSESNENGEGQPKIRKVRSDKGLKRGPYKKRSQVMSEQTQDVVQPTSESSENEES